MGTNCAYILATKLPSCDIQEGGVRRETRKILWAKHRPSIATLLL